MKNRITATLLAFTIFTSLLSGFSCLAAGPDDPVQTIVTKLAAQSAADRKLVVDAVLPLLMTNVGLEALEYYIDQYTPSATDLFNVMVGKLLGYVDASTCKAFLHTLRVIDEDVRKEYFTAFLNREELVLTPDAQAAFGQLAEGLCAKYDGLEKIMREDGITAGVTAKFFEMFYRMNENSPLFTCYHGTWIVEKIAPSLEESIRLALAEGAGNSGFDNAYDAMTAFAHRLQAALPKTLEPALKTFLAQTGVYKRQNGLDYETMRDAGGYADKYPFLEIFEYIDDVKQPSRVLPEPQTVTILMNVPYAMLYKIEESGPVPVKYTIYTDEGSKSGLTCRIDKTGKYTLMYYGSYFEDTPAWGADYAEMLYQRGIISGKGEHVFAPDDKITREEFVKLIVSLFDMETDGLTAEFSDVAPDAWYAPYLAAAQKDGFIHGVGDGRFGVGQNITRQDIATILYSIITQKQLFADVPAQAAGFTDAAQIADYAKTAVGELAAHGVIAGYEDSSFQPEGNATRMEAAVLIYRMLELCVMKQGKLG